MAIWDIGFFDNNMACDWENGIKDNMRLSYIEEAISPVLTCKKESLDPGDGARALAASEALAKLCGLDGESSSYTKHIDLWAHNFNEAVPYPLVKMAIAAIERILSGDSELKQFWTLRGELDEWKSLVLDLKRRLKRYNEK